MDNLYYKPTLDEFHELFEYEHLVHGEWCKETFYLNDSHIRLVKYIGVEDTVRVKRLDKEDLKDLGFFWQEEDFCYLNSSDYSIEVCEVVITIRGKFPKEGEKLFMGEIQNKSELKKELRKLNIG